jgi:hypothetical protein
MPSLSLGTYTDLCYQSLRLIIKPKNMGQEMRLPLRMLDLIFHGNALSYSEAPFIQFAYSFSANSKSLKNL